jgi:hypothetical protein
MGGAGESDFRVVKFGCEDGLVERSCFEYAPERCNYRQMEVAWMQRLIDCVG